MPERYTRRDILIAVGVLPASAVITMIPEIPINEIDLGSFKAQKNAHNAALDPEVLHKALQSEVPNIEVDLTVADGKLVVAHEPESYLSMTDEVKAFQDAQLVLQKILKAGKVPFLDIKDEVTIDDIAPFIGSLPKGLNPMASSNNHALLNSLRDDIGFDGTLLYSIGNRDVLDRFLTENKKIFDPKTGVSIRHSLLTREVGQRFLGMNLQIAAWNPFEKHSIAAAISNGATIITSDNLKALDEIETGMKENPRL